MEKDIRQQFINLLKKQNCYDCYMVNFKADLLPFYENVEFEHFLQRIHPRSWFSLAFYWNDTPENYDYWWRLNRIWLYKIVEGYNGK